MKYALPLLFAWCLFLLPGRAAPPAPPAPLGAASQFALVSAVNPAQKSIILAMPRQVKKFVQTFVEEKTVVNGMEVTVKKVIPQEIMVTETVQINWFAATNKAHDVDGNLLADEALFKRLKVDNAVLLVPPGQKLHPAYKNVLKGEAVVLDLAVTP